MNAPTDINPNANGESLPPVVAGNNPASPSDEVVAPASGFLAVPSANMLAVSTPGSDRNPPVRMVLQFEGE